MYRNVLKSVWLFVFTLAATQAMALTLSPSAIALTQTYGKTVDTTTVTLTGNYYGQNVYYKVTKTSGNFFKVSPSEGNFYSPGATYVSFPTAATLAPGTYSGSITIQAPATSPYEASVSVKLTITTGTDPCQIGLNPASGFSHSIKSGENVANDTFTVWNANYGASPAMAYTASTNQSWVWCTPTVGTGTSLPDTITLNYDTRALSAGTHTAQVTIVGSNTSNSPQVLPVSVTVREAAKPQITLTPATGFDRSCNYGSVPSNDTFQVGNANYGESNAMPFTVTSNVSWITLTPPSGSASGTKIPVTVSYNTKTLSAGVHNAVITVNAPGASNTPATLPVKLTVKPLSGSPTIGLSVNSLARSVNLGSDLFTDSIDLWNENYGASSAMQFSVSGSTSWLTVAPASGTATSDKVAISAIYNTAGMIAGTYRASLTVTAAGASNSPLNVPVTLTITASGSKTDLSVSPSIGFHHNIPKGIVLPSDTLQLWNRNYSINAPGVGWTATCEDPWITLTPASGTLLGTKVPVTVGYTTTNLASGTHTAHILITPNVEGAAPLAVPVMLTVTGGNNADAEIAFDVSGGLTRTVKTGSSPAADTVNLWNKTYGKSPAVAWTATTDAPWLTVSPAKGMATDMKSPLTLKYATENLAQGRYVATVVVNAPGAINTPQRLQITVQVKDTVPTQQIAVNPATGFARSVVSGNSPADDILEVWNRTYAESGTMPFTVSCDASWVTLTPTSGSATDTRLPIAVHYETSSMVPGTYTAYITVVAPGASTPQAVVPVQLSVTDTPKTAIGISPTSGFSRSANTGATITSDLIEVWNSNYATAPQQMPYVISGSASWLSFSPAAGTVNGETAQISVNYNTTGLAAGTYNAQISVISTGASNTPRTIPVSLTLTYVAPPSIVVTPTSLRLDAMLDQLPSDGWCPSQLLSISNGGSGTLSYAFSSNTSWMGISPNSGSTTNTVQSVWVNYNNLRSMNVGTYGGTITVTSTNASNSPVTIPVTLVIGESSSGVWYSSQFSSNITTGWTALQPSMWALSSGAYSAVSSYYGQTMQSTYSNASWLSNSLTVSMRRVHTNNYTQYQGLFFRASDDFSFDWYGSGNKGQAYVLLIGGNQWRLFFLNNGYMTNVTGWNSSDFINTASNSTNTVNVMSEDNYFTVSVNNRQLWTGYNNIYRRPGKVGLIGINPTTGYTPAFYFDSVTVSNPE